MVKTINLKYDEGVFKTLKKLKDATGLAWEEYFLSLAEGRPVPAKAKKEALLDA